MLYIKRSVARDTPLFDHPYPHLVFYAHRYYHIIYNNQNASSFPRWKSSATGLFFEGKSEEMNTERFIDY